LRQLEANSNNLIDRSDRVCDREEKIFMKEGPIKLLGLSGSLRKESASTALLKSLGKLVKDKADLSIFSLAEIPLYNGDIDGDRKPVSVEALRQAILLADGLVISSPEYNYGMPGVLKNALDWASRPAYASPLQGKHVLLFTSSPGPYGGVRAQSQLRDTLTSTLSRVVPHPHIGIGGVYGKLSNGELTDEHAQKALVSGLESLLQEIVMRENDPK
jgi:chromate reductase